MNCVKVNLESWLKLLSMGLCTPIKQKRGARRRENIM